MELGQLRIFLAVVEHRGFRRAAAHLYLSQPAVSRHIADLERSLGTALFLRDRRGVTLTAAGSRFSERAQAILDDCDLAVREARAEAFRGELRVGVTPGAVGPFAIPILRQLARAFPLVGVTPVQVPVMCWSEAPPTDLDLLMVRDPIRPEAARSTVVLEEPMVLTAGGTIDLPEDSISSADACELPMVRFDPGTPRRLREFWSLATARNSTTVDFRGEGVQDQRAMASSVASGLGVAVASPSLIQMYASDLTRWSVIEDAPRVRGLVTSRRDDHRPVIDEAHRQIQRLVDRIGPLISTPVETGRSG